MSKHIVCVIQPRGAVEILGSYADAGEAARACNTSGPGSHVVCDGVVLRFHGRTDKRLQALVEKALREKKHPALAAPAVSAAPAEADDSEAIDEDSERDHNESEDERSETLASTEPSAPTAPSSALPERTHTEVQHGRGGPPQPVTVRGRTLTRAGWASELGVTETAMYLSVRKLGGTWEDEIERRLVLREATGSAKAPGPPRGPRRSPPPRAIPPVPALRVDSTDGTLDDLREILRVAAEHGGLRQMLTNAEVGRKVRSLIEEARG